MSFMGTFSPSGFRVVADNALDYVVGAQVTGAGHVGATVRELGRTLHTDIDALARTVASGTTEIRDVNVEGFSRLGDALAGGFSSLKALAGANLAVQAAGFVVIAKQLHSVGGDLKGLREDLARQGAAVLEAQRVANVRLETLVDFAERTLKTQEAILATLVSSRTVEAQQLIRQGWENLRHGYIDDAYSRFMKSLEFDNTVYVAHAQLADIHSDRGEPGLAEEHYRRAVAFASSAGSDVHAYALLRLASFLEKQARVEEALREIDRLLELGDRPEWRFYRTELLARLGHVNATLEEVGKLVSSDGQYFAAIVGSEPIAQIGAPLIEKLALLDEAARSPIFEMIRVVPAVVVTLDALAAVRPDVITVSRVEELRQDGAELLSEMVTAPFDALDRVRRDVASFVELLDDERDEVLRNIAAPARSLLADVQAHDVVRPQKETAVAPGLFQKADDIAKGVLVGLGAGALLVLCAVVADERLRLGGGWFVVAVPLSGVLGVKAGRAFMERERRVRTAGVDERARASYSRRFGAWRARAATLIDALEAELRRASGALEEVSAKVTDAEVSAQRDYAREALADLEQRRASLAGEG